MASIEISYKNGEEIYVCSECGKNIPPEYIEDWQYEECGFCPKCGSTIDELPF